MPSWPPRYRGLRVVIAISYARIRWQNLINFGVLPLEFSDESDYERVQVEDELVLTEPATAIALGHDLDVRNLTSGTSLPVRHRLSPRQIELVLAGGRIADYRRQQRIPGDSEPGTMRS
jgi:aconitate hydratase